MLLVKTKLGMSGIHGIGLFADQFIGKDELLWRYDGRVDRKLTIEDIERLAPASREQVRRYSYREKFSGLYVLCGDDARFFNHASSPNCLDTEDGEEGLTLAARDIQPGEELICDYALFDQDWIEGKHRF